MLSRKLKFLSSRTDAAFGVKLLHLDRALAKSSTSKDSHKTIELLTKNVTQELYKPFASPQADCKQIHCYLLDMMATY